MISSTVQFIKTASLFIYLFIYFFQVEGEATQRAIVIADQVNLKADTPVLYRTGFGMFV